MAIMIILFIIFIILRFERETCGNDAFLLGFGSCCIMLYNIGAYFRRMRNYTFLSLQSSQPTCKMHWGRFTALTVTVLLFVVSPSCAHNLHLTILHTSDISSRFEEVNLEGTECTEIDIQNGTCFGGMPRICQYVNSTRQERKGNINVLLVDAGDMFIGDFYNVYKGVATAQLMNKCGYDAMVSNY